MGFYIPMTGVVKLVSMNGILILHIMDYTSNLTWMDLNTFPSMVSVWNTIMGFYKPMTGVTKLVSINGILILHIMVYTSKSTLMDLNTLPSMVSV